MLPIVKSNTNDMKTYKLSGSIIRIKLYAIVLLLLVIKTAIGQDVYVDSKKTIAVMGIDVQGIDIPKETIRNMVHLEVEKANIFSVLDRYDIDDLLKQEDIPIDACYGKNCLANIGKLLKVDLVLTGNVEKMGDKIVMSFRYINVYTEMIEEVAVVEFMNLPEEIDKMIMITINKLFDIKNDENLVNMLVDYDKPISSPKTTLKLNGPRMGASITFGPAAERLQAPEREGGYEMFPLVTQFGYQFETQYLSAGTFQALIEYIGMIGGLESGKFIPSIAVMNGFRSSANGWEFAFGPVFKLVRSAYGYYDQNGDWKLEYEWNSENGENPYEIVEMPDNRGDIKFTTNLIIAVGKTFKSGYLNVPVNVYVIPNKKGTIVGTSIGFNITKRTKKL